MPLEKAMEDYFAHTKITAIVVHRRMQYLSEGTLERHWVASFCRELSATGNIMVRDLIASLRKLPGKDTGNVIELLASKLQGSLYDEFVKKWDLRNRDVHFSPNDFIEICQSLAVE